MTRLRLLLSDISGITGIQVAYVVSALTLLGLLVAAYETNATDKEVKSAVDGLKLENKQELALFMSKVLASLEALEARVASGDNSILIEMITSDIRRLNRQVINGNDAERADAKQELLIRREQLDALMDQMRLSPNVRTQLTR